ncbi:MAG TPA: YezD family protein [Candidatus Angelobacter sp.]|nr:YezD family protein [Candidatus Angelobacter sp.]
MKAIGPISGAQATDNSWLEIVRRQVISLNFGMVRIVVHGARLIQIERTEKLRLEHPIVSENRAD